MRVYPKVSGLAAWSENCKWYSSLPLDAVLSLFFVLLRNKCLFLLFISSRLSPETFGYTLVNRDRLHADSACYCVHVLGSTLFQGLSPPDMLNYLQGGQDRSFYTLS